MTLSLRERKKQETHAAIVKAAKKLFVEQGYDATGMDEIAMVAGVSRTTLFNYFANKNALVVAMVERREQAFREFVIACCDEGKTTEQRITLLFRRWADYLLESVKLHAMITTALTGGARSDQGNSAALGGYIGAFRQLVDAGIKQGDIRTDFSPEVLTQMLVSSLLTGSYMLFQGQGEDIEKYFMEAASFIAEAISAK